MATVVFVCTGNICRSPMARALLQSRLKGEPDTESWIVDSAGTLASLGAPASTNSQLAMKARGLDISDHRSKPVSHELLRSADLVLTMERDHKEELQQNYPDLAGRIHMLSEIVGRQEDIADPIGGPLVEYENTARELDGILDKGLKKILRLAV